MINILVLVINKCGVVEEVSCQEEARDVPEPSLKLLDGGCSI